ncbi:hypothetical protein [Phaeobacter italicus]|uniref:hypothetical protein n=1 Tax=Phaeobacter italicus TaxID=481446 RepID=UPI00232EBE04|nr:hypothetical protein [Phaeobacter italicus]
MYFPPHPSNVYEIVGGSFSVDLLGRRVSDVGGNEAAHKAYQRANKFNIPIEQLKRSQGGRAILEAYREKFQRLNAKQADRDWFAAAKPEDMGTAWSSLLFATKYAKTLPQTVHFMRELAKGATACRGHWNKGEREAAIQILAELPWAHTNTMQWYLGALRASQEDLPEIWHLPAEMAGLCAAVQMAMIESKELGARGGRSWSIDELMAARHPGTGHLAAIRYFIERTKAAAGIETQKELAEIALAGGNAGVETVQREVKAYRAGKRIPSLQVCLNIVENMKSRTPEQSSWELFFLAAAACFCQKVFNRCQNARGLTLEPIALFDDFQAIREIPKARLQEAMSRNASRETIRAPYSSSPP